MEICLKAAGQLLDFGSQNFSEKKMYIRRPYNCPAACNLLVDISHKYMGLLLVDQNQQV